METLDAKNEESSKIFSEKPEGRDDYETTNEGTLLLGIIPLSSDNEVENSYNNFYFRLNKHSLYYTEKARSYRGVFGSMNL
mmetsp:Transcript_130344/g.193953  ORF Transcript_130344/g.193953 Transcript_130344/m.193953 type:complete len:81 (+) Transcript_130344:177-419(+)